MANNAKAHCPANSSSCQQARDGQQCQGTLPPPPPPSHEQEREWPKMPKHHDPSHPRHLVVSASKGRPTLLGTIVRPPPPPLHEQARERPTMPRLHHPPHPSLLLCQQARDSQQCQSTVVRPRPRPCPCRRCCHRMSEPAAVGLAVRPLFGG